MLTAITKRLLGAALALSSLSFSGVAAAETMELSYAMPKIGIEYLYRGMGYNDADGNFIDLAGSHITSATVIVDFRPAPGVDIGSFFMGMNVPVLGPDNVYFVVDGSMLEKSGLNHYTYSFTTDLFNGEIYSGRFSIESYGLDAMGNPIGLPGFVGATTGFYFDVDVATAPVPEPTSAAMLLAGLALVPMLARRRRSREA